MPIQYMRRWWRSTLQTVVHCTCLDVCSSPIICFSKAMLPWASYILLQPHKCFHPDVKGTVACETWGPWAVEAPQQQMHKLRRKRKKQVWRIHQSMVSSKPGKRCWVHCPGLKASAANKRPWTYETFMWCEKCSAKFEKDVFLCNDTKKRVPILCHQAYHNQDILC